MEHFSKNELKQLLNTLKHEVNQPQWRRYIVFTQRNLSLFGKWLLYTIIELSTCNSCDWIINCKNLIFYAMYRNYFPVCSLAFQFFLISTYNNLMKWIFWLFIWEYFQGPFQTYKHLGGIPSLQTIYLLLLKRPSSCLNYSLYGLSFQMNPRWLGLAIWDTGC